MPRTPAKVGRGHTMELAGAVTLFLIAYLSCLALLFARRRASPGGRLPPGPTPLPLIGNFLQIKASKTLQSLLKLREKYGPVFTVYFGNRPVVVLCGHDAVKEALIDKAEEFAGRKTNATLERTFQGHGVVFANGERWKQLRRFSLSILRNFGMGKKSIEERIQEETQFLLEELQKTQEKPFNPIFFLSCAVSNVICSIVFGNRFDYKDKEFLDLLKMINDLFREMSTGWSQIYDMYANLLKYFPGPHTKIYDILEDMRLFIAKRVMKNKETLDPNSPRGYIVFFLIQMEKEKDNPASEFNLKNLELTTLTLFIAGTETVSSTLRYGFLLLMKFPEVQAKMHEEIDRVIGQNRIPNIEDRSRMPYVDAVIHEVQRFSDLIPMNVPHTVTCDTEFRGYFIPKGTEIYPLLSTVLHDSTKFESPYGFHPENFLDEDGHLKKNDAFVPFSSGKRICLGEALARMELFLFFTTVLQRFRLKPTMDPQDIDLSPQELGFATIPPFYELSVVPR
ncbi:cytochrome P450 2G1-like isoform X2 [Python bivittatus]|uniref:Cytochrome P450 2G1-like isoform X2 n=1 Tax=Python bivittatus TaxID=176946 RepID=A0A9F3QUS9_PYTBI|nr:cytochrome P450 2G1-like isoform X2 [Python bivittatus]